MRFQNQRYKTGRRVALFLLVWLALSPSALWAQRNTSSPYSRYGYGTLNEPLMGPSVAMGGVAYGLRQNTYINPMNPATHSAVDSMSFLFDFGFKGDVSFFKDNGVKQHNAGYSLDHVAFKFPLARNWGLSGGLYEFSSLGFTFSNTGTLPGMEGEDEVSYLRTYSAQGGINNVYLGTSIFLFRHLSLGVNWNIRFGTLTYQQSLTYPNNSSYTSLSVSDHLQLTQHSFDFGLQYYQRIGKKHELVLGAVFTPSSMFKSNASSVHVSRDTMTYESDYRFGTPQTIGAGFSYTFDRRLVIAADYQTKAWSKIPYYNCTDSLASTQRISLGVEYLPARLGNHYFQVLKYRAGLHYSESYIKFAGGSLKEVGASIGAGFPLRAIRSVLNVTFEGGRLLTPDPSLIQEGYVRLNVGVTFNETWFMKRKFY